MRLAPLRTGLASLALVLAATCPLHAQQPPDTFRWTDFHAQKDQDIVAWVTRSLEPEKWTAIREIGVIYDAALVVTTYRASPQSPPSADTFTVWSASLTSHAILPLLSGVNLRWQEPMHFLAAEPPEPAILYDNCSQCAADIFFTAFYYEFPQHMWSARWLRGGQGAPLWNAHAVDGVALTQVYAALTEPSGQEFVAVWSHFDYGKQKPAADFVYRYDLDPISRLERIVSLDGKEREAMKQRLCRAQDAAGSLARGQDSPLCQQTAKPIVLRKPVTTPPANNHGQSVPPGARR